MYSTRLTMRPFQYSRDTKTLCTYLHISLKDPKNGHSNTHFQRTEPPLCTTTPTWKNAVQNNGNFSIVNATQRKNNANWIDTLVYLLSQTRIYTEYEFMLIIPLYVVFFLSVSLFSTTCTIKAGHRKKDRQRIILHVLNTHVTCHVLCTIPHHTKQCIRKRSQLWWSWAQQQHQRRTIVINAGTLTWSCPCL